jgi:hypothetical protein
VLPVYLHADGAAALVAAAEDSAAPDVAQPEAVAVATDARTTAGGYEAKLELYCIAWPSAPVPVCHAAGP